MFLSLRYFRTSSWMTSLKVILLMIVMIVTIPILMIVTIFILMVVMMTLILIRRC
ncbi:hypothetical protein KSP40_PGU005933 [Platanthera guangdongensis]|uniref:Uncharacterized protein n=1 Tax=Platanthera guangdongensis TaxID=2320717 RepID=A0ABR2MJK1_9ASPA